MSTHTAQPASARAATRLEQLGARVARLDHLVMLRVFLGALFITVFFENLAFGRYTPGGYERLIERYAARNNAPASGQTASWDSSPTTPRSSQSCKPSPR